MSVPTPRDLSPTVRELSPSPRDEAPTSRQASVARHAASSARAGGLEAAVATSRGRWHAVNEDCHSSMNGREPLFVVADGVGGGALASLASRQLVSRLHEALEGHRPDPGTLSTALRSADRAIALSIASRTERVGAATVALCTATTPSLSTWLIAWVGDCRIYRVDVAAPDRPAELLTVDDTYRHLREMHPVGGSPDDPARMVGNGAVDAPNVRSVELAIGQMLVLCSDGVHKHADAREIARLLRAPAPLAARCVGLIEHARARGSQDDATVLVVHRARRRYSRLRSLVTTGVLLALLLGALVWLWNDQAVALSGATGSATTREGS